ncbi:MAG: TetR/AcrR family transcriptional regulator [Myxococcales bacterium]
MSARSTPPRPRRTQQERRDDTQRRLLEATLACLTELGYARTTTPEIVKLAGVSQGALFKHYPSKAELLSAAVEHLFASLVHGYQTSFADLPQGAATAEVSFELLWRLFTGPRLAVAFELYTAARTDPDLQAALMPVVQQHRRVLVDLARRLFPQAAREIPEFDAWVDLLMCSMEGLVVESYGAGNVAGPALAVLKQLMLGALTRGSSTSPRDLRDGGTPWTP